MKEEVPRQAAALLERDTQALAAVDADRLQRIEFMENMREQALWDIKEAVWKLGYPTGYRLGDDEEGEFFSRESEILAEITALREAYEEQVEGTLAGAAQRVADEKAAAEAAYLAAQAEIDAVQEAQRLATEQVITTITQNLESSFSGASSTSAADAAAAREALQAFIDGRLAEWGALYAREENTAKWQEDSYYRFQLLRLLDAKQDAIDEAVAAAMRDFDDAMAALREGSTTINTNQRETSTRSVAGIRQSFADGQAETDALMAQAAEQGLEDLCDALEEQ